ncbi:MAG: coproporphyrinogen III oxidase [Rhodobacteraceae bacterium]|nr:coproporphyrinogen III oxidase [Paracoccaceae bacterium]
MAEAPWREAGFGLYFHWPFCQAKCPYCDFNSHVTANVDQTRWAAAYEAEIARIAVLTGPRIVSSVFIGGGTPSLMQPEVVDRIMRAVRAAWPMANDTEITMEANPASSDLTRFEGYAAAGINRLSMGIQALNDKDLRALGRLHSVAEAKTAFAAARGLFGQVSFDLIYARQGQTAADWGRELREALDMAVDHLSLYQLTIEEGTAFGARLKAGKLRNLPNEDLAADMWDMTQAVTAEYGMDNYEISNHARPDAQSKHNQIYWRCGDWAGIGPGAHGRLTLDGIRWATAAPLAPGAWLTQVEKHGHGDESKEVLSRDDQLSELLLMGLRLREGVALPRIAALSGGALTGNIAELVEMGMVEQTQTHLRTTEKGMPLLNAVLRQLLA